MGLLLVSPLPDCFLHIAPSRILCLGGLPQSGIAFCQVELGILQLIWQFPRLGQFRSLQDIRNSLSPSVPENFSLAQPAVAPGREGGQSHLFGKPYQAQKTSFGLVVLGNRKVKNASLAVAVDLYMGVGQAMIFDDLVGSKKPVAGALKILFVSQYPNLNQQVVDYSPIVLDFAA